MATRVAVVLYCDQLIGYNAVKKWCKEFDGHVYLIARYEDRGKTALKELQKEGLDPKLHLLDIPSLDRIKKLASFIKSTYGGLDLLINNVLISYIYNSTVPFGEQAEHTIRADFFSYLDVFHELFPLLRPHARVVNIFDSASKLSNIKSKELQAKFLNPNLSEEELCELMKQFVEDTKTGVYREKGWPDSTHEASKLGLTALSFIQQRKFLEDPRPNIVVNAIHLMPLDADMSSYKDHFTLDLGIACKEKQARIRRNSSMLLEFVIQGSGYIKYYWKEHSGFVKPLMKSTAQCINLSIHGQNESSTTPEPNPPVNEEPEFLQPVIEELPNGVDNSSPAITDKPSASVPPLQREILSRKRCAEPQQTTMDIQKKRKIYENDEVECSYFLKSMEPCMVRLSLKGRSNFKMKVLKLMNEAMEEEGLLSTDEFHQF